MSEASLLVTIALMLIGGASGSTAGGMKITTMAVLFCAGDRGGEKTERGALLRQADFERYGERRGDDRIFIRHAVFCGQRCDFVDRKIAGCRLHVRNGFGDRHGGADDGNYGGAFGGFAHYFNRADVFRARGRTYAVYGGGVRRKIRR